ncbi:hypothetical protein BC834DRAFT_325893 [Gloeopeniophorella convolvens]|nr:hypothetical protein BC834DRAFT_325893 [Gloeopeniophorella convolvens]
MTVRAPASIQHLSTRPNVVEPGSERAGPTMANPPPLSHQQAPLSAHSTHGAASRRAGQHACPPLITGPLVSKTVYKNAQDQLQQARATALRVYKVPRRHHHSTIRITICIGRPATFKVLGSTSALDVHRASGPFEPRGRTVRSPRCANRRDQRGPASHHRCAT